jgi:hypothetical protein
MLATLIALAGLQSALDDLKAEAMALQSMIETPLGKSYVAAVRFLPPIANRTVWLDEAAKRYYPANHANLDSAWKRTVYDERFYYYTKYGSPLSYTRAMDLLGHAGLKVFGRKKILDFGYGGIGPLRLISALGGHAVGVDIDSLLKALYSEPSDTGALGAGRIDLVEGYFPSDPKTSAAVGSGYDVFLSKNTLKRGYVHPEKPVDKRMLVDLGVSDKDFCLKVAAILRRGGIFLIYNLSPAQNPSEKPYLPWADGRCPFDKSTLEAAGFEVLSFDVNDNTAAREMGRRLGWDKGTAPMDLEKDLFAHYILARKR